MILGKTTATGELELVNAGHLPALLVQPSGITVFESNTLPVGMFCNQEFTASRTRLSPGDTLVLYTDGISETLNDADEEFGTQKLRTLLEDHRLSCPNQLIEACRRHVDQFRGDRERFDDETLLAIQYAPGAGETHKTAYV
jgi:sigma-B regulation protein RsbU (phosphoserine phosphatase)